MRLDVFLLIWSMIIIGFILEAYFAIPYDKDFNKHKQKRDKENEHKSTN